MLDHSGQACIPNDSTEHADMHISFECIGGLIRYAYVVYICGIHMWYIYVVYICGTSDTQNMYTPYTHNIYDIYTMAVILTQALWDPDWDVKTAALCSMP